MQSKSSSEIVLTSYFLPFFLAKWWASDELYESIVEYSPESTSLKARVELDSVHTHSVAMQQPRLVRRSLVPASSWLGKDSSPSKFLLQKVGIAQKDPIRRSKLDKKTIPFEIQLR